MPRRNDLHSILIIGSGPIVIGQACEFDYSGTQACKVLREDGFRVILVNSNPATIMTDPEFADRTYIEPITPEIVAAVIEAERPDALLADARRTDRAEYRGRAARTTACSTATASSSSARRSTRSERPRTASCSRPRWSPIGIEVRALGLRLHARRSAQHRRRDRVPGRDPSELHPRRSRLGRRPRPG